jgi:AraC-like DNA-binding protein
LVNRHRHKGFPRIVNKSIHYIDVHLSEKIALNDIAAHANVSAGYLSTVFSKEMHMPISEYILMKKVQESSYFITHKEYSIAEVAALYNFSSQSYYIKTFKRFMGATPGAYRSRSIR